MENGYAGRCYGTYGGYKLTKDARKRFPDFNENSVRNIDVIEQAYLADIKKFGVNWAKTAAPMSDMESVFNGTFAEPGTKEMLKGVLVLNDGSKQEWLAEALEVSNVFEMMAMVDDARARFETIFWQTLEGMV